MRNLYKSEAELKWLNEQRNLIKKEITNIARLVAEHTLIVEEPVFQIICEISTTMDGLSIRIYNSGEDVDRLELWNLALITKSVFFNKERIENEVKDTIDKLRKYKATVKKYIKLNLKKAVL